MNLEEWRKAQTTEATLPSGLEVVLKRLTVFDLAQSGRIPETIRPAVDTMLASGTEGVKITLANMQDFAAVVDVVAAACLVGPEGLTVAELPWLDKQSIFMWANEASAQLGTFRTKQDGVMEAARSRK